MNYLFILLITGFTICELSDLNLKTKEPTNEDLGIPWIEALQNAYKKYVIFEKELLKQPDVIKITSLKSAYLALNVTFTLVKGHTIDLHDRLRMSEIYEGLSRSIRMGIEAFVELNRKNKTNLCDKLIDLLIKMQIAHKATSYYLYDVNKRYLCEK